MNKTKSNKFVDIINIDNIENYLKSFSDFSGYNIDIYDPLTKEQIIYYGNELCTKCHFIFEDLLKLHYKNNQEFGDKSIKEKKIIITNCHDNYYRAYIPVFIDETPVAIIALGPVIDRTKKTRFYSIKNCSYLADKLPEYNHEKLLKTAKHILKFILQQIDNVLQTEKLLNTTKRLYKEIEKNKELQANLEEQNQKLKDYNERIVSLFEKSHKFKNFYKSIFETTGSITLVINEKGVIEKVNTLSEDYFGFTKDNIIGKVWFNFIDDENINELINNHKNRVALQKEDAGKYITKIKTKNGESKNVLLYSRLIKGTSLIVVSIVDIHEYIETQKKLFDTNQRYKTIANSIEDCIFVLDTEGRYQYLNKAFEKITGYNRKDFIGQHFIKKIHPKYHDYLRISFKSALNNNETKYHRIEFYNIENKLIPIELNVSNLFDYNGNVIGRIGIFRDIRKQLEYENKIKESEHLYKAIVENINDGIYIYQENKIVFMNNLLKDMLKYNEEELSADLLNIFENKDIGLTMLGNAKKRLNNKPLPEKFSINLKNKEGVLFPANFSVKVINYKGKKAILGIVKDLSEKVKKESEIKKLYTAIQNSPQAILIANYKGDIEYANSAVLTNLGYSSYEEIIGCKTFFAVDKEQLSQIKEKVLQTVKEKNTWQGEVTLTRKDGSKFIAYVIYSIFKNGKFKNTIIHFTDITKQKEIENEIIKAKEKAEESNRLKTAFIANMNHEIRTPMNAIIGFSSLLSDASPSDKDKFAKIIHSSSKQLMSLINDIIEISILQSGETMLEKQFVNVIEQVDEVCEMLKFSNENKNIKFIKKINPNIKTLIAYTNQEKFKQVISNLISNAVKYTKEGVVELSLDVEDKNIVIKIKDTGIGISDEDRNKIFNTFYRGDNAIKEAIRGTGLGLSIVKEICKKMNYDIYVESELNKGSVFTIKLPYKDINIIEEKDKTNNKETEMLGQKILLAEDELSNYLFLETILKVNNIKIDWAKNGKEAVEMAKENTYDLILMDIKMPELNGIEATKQIRSLGVKTPIIAQSAFVSESKKQEAKKAGMNDYISKPIDGKELMQKIKKWTNEFIIN